MKKTIYLALCLSSGLLAADPVCKRCEIIREHNKECPGDYEYYEDYLKAQEKGKGGTPSAEQKNN